MPMADNRPMATKKPKGLGLGLEALLGPKVVDAPAGALPTTLRLSQLRSGRYQPRTRMDEGSLYELAESIKSQGVMQPVLVRPISPGRYEIIAGERRVRAANLAGLDEVPVLVRAVPDEAAAVMALIENIQREDLNPLEEAQGLQAPGRRIQAHARAGGAGGGPLAQCGVQPAAAAQPGRAGAADADGRRHRDGPCARAADARRRRSRSWPPTRVSAKKLSVRETEKLVARRGNEGRQSPLMRVKHDKSRDIVRLEEALADQLTAAVEIRVQRKTHRGEQGEIAIAFDSLDELNGLLDKLGVRER